MKSLDYKFDFRDERNLSLVMDFYDHESVLLQFRS